jgi:hypothetical protein
MDRQFNHISENAISAFTGNNIEAINAAKTGIAFLLINVRSFRNRQALTQAQKAWVRLMLYLEAKLCERLQVGSYAFATYRDLII